MGSRFNAWRSKASKIDSSFKLMEDEIEQVRRLAEDVKGLKDDSKSVDSNKSKVN